MMLGFANVFTLLSLVSFATAADTTLLWVVQQYEDMTLSVGDTITFDWFGTFHDVYIHPTGDCTETGRIEVGVEGPALYTFTKDGKNNYQVFLLQVATTSFF